MDGIGRMCAGTLRCVADQSPSLFPSRFAILKINLVMQSHIIAYHDSEVKFTSVICGHEAAAVLK